MLRNKKIIMLAMMLFGTFNFSSEAQAETCQGWVPISVDDIRKAVNVALRGRVTLAPESPYFEHPAEYIHSLVDSVLSK